MGWASLTDGARVYFIAPRAPFGSMAEYTVVSRAMTIPLSANIEDAVAAALGNPGLATWGSLLGRAKLQPGEVVLINGATGIAGKQAIQVAKYLGASKIIATGRGNKEALAGLAALGADETISLSQPERICCEVSARHCTNPACRLFSTSSGDLRRKRF